MRGNMFFDDSIMKMTGVISTVLESRDSVYRYC